MSFIPVGEERRATGKGGVALRAQLFTTPDIEPRPSGVIIEARQIIDARKIGDIVISAFEGGITYWCVSIKRDRKGCEAGRFDGLEKDEFIMAGGVFLVVAESHGEGPFKLDAAALGLGMARAADHAGKSLYEWFENHDVSDADVAVQFALFGEIVYG